MGKEELRNKYREKIIFYIVLLSAIFLLTYYIYFGLIKCSHNFWTDWIGDIIGVSCYP